MGSVNTGPLANPGGPVQVVQVRRLSVDVGLAIQPQNADFIDVQSDSCRERFSSVASQGPGKPGYRPCRY